MPKNKAVKTDHLLHQESFTVRSFDVDLAHKLKIATLCSMFQEAASNHAQLLGVGYDQLRQQQQLWVLSRLQIHIEKMPVWYDTVIVRTWAKGVDRLYAVRDFEVSYLDGEILCKASSYWLMLDAVTYRPVRPEAYFLQISLPERHALPHSIEKIDIPEVQEPVYTLAVQYTDLDHNQHVNNVQYINWLLNSFSPQQYEGQTVRSLQINFLSEFRYGDVVHVHQAQGKEAGTYIVFGKKEEKAAPGFAATLTFGT